MSEETQHIDTPLLTIDPVQQEETVMTEAPSSTEVNASAINDISNKNEVSAMSETIEDRVSKNIRDEEELKEKIRQNALLYQKSTRAASFKEALRDIFPELRKNMNKAGSSSGDAGGKV